MNRQYVKQRQWADDELLLDLLNDNLSSDFEDNVAIRLAVYALPIEQQADPAEARKIYRNYEKARLAYLRALADVIRNQDTVLEE